MSSSSRSERVDRIVSYIKSNLGEIDCAPEVANAFDVCYETLRKQFRKEVGITIGQYIRQARVDEARRLLLETDKPVYRISWEVGYSSDSSGIRAFKRETGFTMGEYRKQHRENKRGS